MPGGRNPSPIPSKLCPSPRRDVDNLIDQSKDIFRNKLYCVGGEGVCLEGSEPLCLESNQAPSPITSSPMQLLCLSVREGT